MTGTPANLDWALLPQDDNARPFADSILPPAMIEAGVTILDKIQNDLRGSISEMGTTPDWDSGMIAVALYRAMTAAAPANASLSRISALSQRLRSDAKNIGHDDRSVYPVGSLLDAADALDAILKSAAALPFSYPHRKLSATATVFAFHPWKGMLGGIRHQNAQIFPGMLCAPGGFQEALWEGPIDPHPGETIEETAVRELFEEMTLSIPTWRLSLFTISSHPKTDARCHVVNACYTVMLEDHEAEMARAGDDLQDIDWVTPYRIREGNEPWAFNHLELSRKALDHVTKTGML